MSFDSMIFSGTMTFGEYKRSPEYRINSLSSTVFYICIGKCGDSKLNSMTMNQRISWAASMIKVKQPDLEDMVWAKVSENITLNKYNYPGKDRKNELTLYERI